MSDNDDTKQENQAPEKGDLTKTFCGFCGKSAQEVKKLVAGPSTNICDECVDQCSDIMNEAAKPAFSGKTGGVPTPKDINAHLDDYVIGQAKAKRVLSVAVHNHYKRLAHGGMNNKGVELSKSNILLTGPTGTGKTLLAQTLARMLDVPFTMADATTLTEAGYVGEDVENIIQKLLMAADYDIEKAQRGIIYIDEIDKIGRKQDGGSITRDVSGEGVQQALLKIIEGTVASIPPQGGRKHPQQEFLQVDTSNILFICGGSFAGIEQVINARLNQNDGAAIGFGANIKDPESNTPKKSGELLSRLEPEDLLRFGLIPEFIGRLPVITALQDLEAADLVKIMTEPKNSLVQQFQTLFEFDNALLKFEPEALKAIAEKAIIRGTGARGLRSILEKTLEDPMFELPGMDNVSEVVVTKDVVTKGKKPKYVKALKAA